ncbi:hypothetical protein J6Z19_06880 [bacterium]|nr:hypothetical protein [bacterium]
MNSANFTVFLSMQDVLRKIVISFDYYNESISAEIEDKNVKENNILLDLSEKTARRIVIPEKLLNALVIGISEEGSTRSAKRLAWSKLLNVKKACSSGESFSSMDLSDIDCIIISGGYDDSINRRLNSVITSLGRNPQLAELKPKIIFAGSRLSADIAKKELALPGIQFKVLKNILENETLDDDGFAKTLPITSTVTQTFSEGRIKITDFSYTEALRKISEVFCMKRGEKVLSLLFTENYSLLSHGERGARATAFRNYAVPQKAETLDFEVFKSVFNDLFMEGRTVFDENFLQKDVLPIDSDKESLFFEPDRIVAVSLTEKINFENFIDLVCIPGITRGTFYFLFDNSGIVLAAMTVFLTQNKDSNPFLRGFFNTQDIKNGWIFIPYGKFKKGAPAVFIEKLESDRKEDFILRWGDRKIIVLNANSVVEIHTAKGVFLSNSADSTKKTIGTKESGKTLIFDLREEMHGWK